jgi:HEAT repeat protein
MEMEKERIEGAIIEEPEEVPTSSWVLVGQFFLVPVIIVAICVGIFFLFGLITGDSRTARDYLEEVKAGKGSRRWQAAFELSRYLNSRAGDRSRDSRLAQDMSAAYRGAKEDDPRVRQYLALAMGKLRDSAAVEPLIESLDDSDADTKLYIISALGELRDARAVEPLLKLGEHPDPQIRKMVAYDLGILQDSRAVPYLKGALNDKSPDVSWNSALALARLRDPSGVDVLHQMLDRKHLETLPELKEIHIAEAMINAARAVALLKDSSARPLLDELRKNDKDIKVRAAAIDALKDIP